MKQLKKTFKLDTIVNLPNIAEEMDEEDLSRLASEVITSVDVDIESRSEWERLTEKSLELIELKHEMKHNPWPNASSVKYPLISTAVIQFASRQMPALVRNGKVAEAQVVGSDPTGEKAARASRVAKHMSYQLLHEMDEWEDELDKMMHMLAAVGTVFKKTYYDPIKKRPMSQLCLYDEIIINNDIKNLDDARRITHKVTMHKNDIIERMRLGIYSDMDPNELDREAFESLQQEAIHEVYEQHCYIDLDGDGYEEPYIVLVDRDLMKVLRVVARYDEEDIELNDKDEVIRITPVQHFTDFHFIRSPRGKFYSVGFGQLMYSLNHSVNTILNQLIDAGTLANTQAGLMDKRLKINGGKFDMMPGQFQKVNLSAIDDIKKHIMPLDFKEPSNVLFQLLGTLVQATKEVSSVSDAMTGNEHAQNVAATTMLSLVEQSGKVFSAIQKRIYMGMKKEFEKLFRINRIFLDRQEYFRVLDEEAVIHRDDYEEASLDIKPVADPSISSDAHKVARSQALQQVLLPMAGPAGIDMRAVARQFLEDIEMPNIDKIQPPADPNAPPPIEVLEKQSEMQERGQKIELHKQEVQLESLRSQADMFKKQAEVLKLNAEATKLLAEAEAVEPGVQFAQQQQMLQSSIQEMQIKLDAMREARNPETQFSEQDVQGIVGGDEDEQQELPGAGAPVEEPRGDELPPEAIPPE